MPRDSTTATGLSSAPPRRGAALRDKTGKTQQRFASLFGASWAYLTMCWIAHVEAAIEYRKREDRALTNGMRWTGKRCALRFPLENDHCAEAFEVVLVLLSLTFSNEALEDVFGPQQLRFSCRRSSFRVPGIPQPRWSKSTRGTARLQPAS
jgi:hypothetical protein